MPVVDLQTNKEAARKQSARAESCNEAINLEARCGFADKENLALCLILTFYFKYTSRKHFVCLLLLYAEMLLSDEDLL